MDDDIMERNNTIDEIKKIAKKAGYELTNISRIDKSQAGGPEHFEHPGYSFGVKLDYRGKNPEDDKCLEKTAISTLSQEFANAGYDLLSKKHIFTPSHPGFFTLFEKKKNEKQQ